MTHKSRKNSCFEVLDGLFCELEASSVTWTYRTLWRQFLQFLMKKKFTSVKSPNFVTAHYFVTAAENFCEALIGFLL